MRTKNRRSPDAGSNPWCPWCGNCVCVCVCVCVCGWVGGCVRACVRACVCVLLLLLLFSSRVDFQCRLSCCIRAAPMCNWLIGRKTPIYLLTLMCNRKHQHLFVDFIEYEKTCVSIHHRIILVSLNVLHRCTSLGPQLFSVDMFSSVKSC